PEVAVLLFSQGHFSMLLREMLQETARRFGLRHRLDEQGIERWSDTVFLQFGFTGRGFRSQLPEWLAGQATTRAVSTLLRQQGQQDQKTGSPEFQRMWEELIAYRRGQITERRLRSTLEDSPWILPEWIDDLIALVAPSPVTTGTGASPAAEKMPPD